MKAGTVMSKIIIFDKKLFTVEATLNWPKHRVLVKSSKDILNSTKRVFRWQKTSFVIERASISKTWKSTHLCATRCKSKINIVHRNSFNSFPSSSKKTFHKKIVHLPTRQCIITHIQKDTEVSMVPRIFFWFLEQGGLAAFVTWPQPNGFCVWSLLETYACASSHASVEALKCFYEKA